MAKSKIYLRKNNWFAMHKVWKGGKYRKVIRKDGGDVDIIMLDNGLLRVFTSSPINGYEPYYVSLSEHEPRPYFYVMQRSGVVSIFDSLSEELLDTLDSRIRTEIEI